MNKSYNFYCYFGGWLKEGTTNIEAIYATYPLITYYKKYETLQKDGY